jgi:hypothetical protein
MKPAPAPHVPGNTEWERFDNAVSMVLAVPKEAFLNEEPDGKRSIAGSGRRRTLRSKGDTAESHQMVHHG